MKIIKKIRNTVASILIFVGIFLILGGAGSIESDIISINQSIYYILGGFGCWFIAFFVWEI